MLSLTLIENLDKLRDTVRGLKALDPVVLQVEREDGLMYLSFKME